jgi:hypothetical protein
MIASEVSNYIVNKSIITINIANKSENNIVAVKNREDL